MKNNDEIDSNRLSFTFWIEIHTPRHVHVRIMKIFQMSMNLNDDHQSAVTRIDEHLLYSIDNKLRILSVLFVVILRVQSKLLDIVQDAREDRL